ncbi:MAG: GGDEF-domain containing protein, partial [Marinobacter sp.]
MTEDFQLEQQPGSRILTWVLTTAIVAGVLLSMVQVIADARRVSEELDRDAQQTLKLIREVATQAIFSLDEALAEQVVNGLLDQDELQ